MRPVLRQFKDDSQVMEDEALVQPHLLKHAVALCVLHVEGAKSS